MSFTSAPTASAATRHSRRSGRKRPRCPSSASHSARTESRCPPRRSATSRRPLRRARRRLTARRRHCRVPARQARQARESLLKTLLAQRRLPEHGWDEPTLKLALAELAALDSNTFVGNAGVGEREGRVVCPLVAARHFGLAHGIGRSGDIAEAQPKAAGSSLIYALTNALAADALRRAGGAGVSECVTLPLATGMSVTLTLLALRQLRPNARHVLWPRIDQKSCLKAVSAAGLTPVPIENVLDGDELRTDLDALAAKLSEIGAADVLCVLTTTSCFAPRAVEKLLDVARLCAEQGVPHLCNNAYGVQCDRCMKAIASASRHGRLDCFIQSTDKNFLVPVGGAIVATADGRHGPEILAKVRSTYAGHASISPRLDLFFSAVQPSFFFYRPRLHLARPRPLLYVAPPRRRRLGASPREEARRLPGLSAQARGGGGQTWREAPAHAKQRHLDVGDAHAAGGVPARRLARRLALRAARVWVARRHTLCRWQDGRRHPLRVLRRALLWLPVRVLLRRVRHRHRGRRRRPLPAPPRQGTRRVEEAAAPAKGKGGRRGWRGGEWVQRRQGPGPRQGLPAQPLRQGVCAGRATRALHDSGAAVFRGEGGEGGGGRVSTCGAEHAATYK
mmetsp:Transcript_23104/g.72620  ORF Transcript_23104/g.72620 Transcript_23104/m.72620 type:complete len:621 (-) Transcript_23104:113-1975(-)